MSSESYSFRYDTTPAALAHAQSSSASQVDFSAPSTSPYNTRRSTSSARTDSKDDDQSSVDANHALILEKKRKNASAQAAFRARRTTYIANLEETVTSLESVVRRLQDACRDSHDEMSELKQDNVRMKAVISGYEERERIWKAYAEATAGTPAGIAASKHLSATPHPVLASSRHSPSQPSGVKTPQSSTGSLHEQPASGSSFEEGTVYGDEPYSFAKLEDGETMAQHSLQLYPPSGQTTAVTTSPTSMTSYAIEHEPSGASLSAVPLTPASSVECHLGGLTSMAYAGGSSIGDQSLFTVDPNMPPPSTNYSANFGLTSYGYSDFGQPPSHPHRSSLPTTLTLDPPAEVMDTATYDLSSPDNDEGSSRPRPTRRHTYSFPSPLPPPPRRSNKKGSTAASSGDASVSSTLAVIKAQAFGNVRKTRARAKKNPTSGEAAKAALEILEARGLGLGLDISGGVKRRKRGDLSGAALSSPMA